MALWKWEAVDERGCMQGGVWDETGEMEVVSRLRGQNLYPVNIRPDLFGFLKLKHNAYQGEIFWARTVRKIGTLLEAGIPLLAIFDLIAEKESKAIRKDKWLKVRQMLQAGNDLVSSIRGFSPPPGLQVEAMISAGEKSGSLASTCLEIAGQLEEEIFFKQRIKGVLFYPLLLLGMALIIIYTLSLVVLPMYQTIFQDLNAGLPVFTQAVFFVGARLPVILFCLILLGFVGRRRLKKIVLLPGIAPIRKNKELLHFCILLQKLLLAGIPVAECLELLGQITPGEELQRIIGKMKLSVQAGEQLAPVVMEDKFFPREEAQMWAIGEESGRLTEMLGYLASVFKKELEEKLQQFSRTLEPVLVLLMSCLVGVVAVSVLLPIFDISAHIR